MRKELIRLGHKSPALRKHLRPILDHLHGHHKTRLAREEILLEGDFVRIHKKRGQEAFRVIELPVKGKRRLRTLLVSGFQDAFSVYPDLFLDGSGMIKEIGFRKSMSYDQTVQQIFRILGKYDKEARAYADSIPGFHYAPLHDFIRFYNDEVHYLQVAPANTRPIKGLGADFSFHLKWDSFEIRQDATDDMNVHDPSYASYENASPAAARKLYKMVNADPTLLDRVRFHDLHDLFQRWGIKYKSSFSSWR